MYALFNVNNKNKINLVVGVGFSELDCLTMKPEDIELLNDFQNYLVTKAGLRPNTAYAFMADARKYLSFYLECWPDKSITMNEDSFQELIGELRKNGLAETTLERVSAGLYRFWEFLYRQGKAEKPPMRRMMDLKFHKIVNPTPRLKPQTYSSIMDAIHEDLQSIW